MKDGPVAPGQEILFSMLAQSSPDCIKLFAPDGTLVFMNESGLREHGYSSVAEAREQGIERTLDAASAAAFKEAFAASLRGDASSIEVQHVPGSSDRSFCLETVTPIRGAEGGVLGVLSVSRDITERKRIETELSSRNRALRLISSINQTLIRAKDETSLLSEAARIIRENGGYPALWVGFEGAGEAKAVRIAAAYGFDQGFLDSVGVTWAEIENGSGPIGTALRARQAQAAPALAKKPSEPWHEKAIEGGCRSVAVFPFNDDVRVFGVLVIYSEKADAFTPDEMKILQELADDLAYGITSLRAAKEVESMNKLMIGRELRMIELKNENDALRRGSGTK